MSNSLVKSKQADSSDLLLDKQLQVADQVLLAASEFRIPIMASILFQLPPKLRDEVYAELFEYDTVYHIYYAGFPFRIESF